MKVRSYGKLADLFGPERDIEIHEPCTVADLRDRLAAAVPEATDSLASGRVRACLGGSIVADSHLLNTNDAVELLAPVSGG